MPKKIIPEFPRENPNGPWPQLQASPQDRRFLPTPESRMEHRWRMMRSSLDLIALDFTSATLKGAILGLFISAISFSFITLRMQGFCWLIGWHWELAIGSIILMFVLAGIDITLLIIAVVALLLGIRTMLAHPLLLLIFIGGGVLLGCILEIFPIRRNTLL